MAYLGIGNENWNCGGNMTPEYYLSQLKIYSRFVRNFNPEQQDASRRMLRIAVGPGGNGRRWTEWTDTIMKAWQGRQWSWDMEGLLLLTDKEKIVRTPTYHAFRMYLPFQDATFVPVAFDAGRYTHGAITLPRVDAIAAKDSAGTLWLALTNIDPARPLEVSARLTGVTARSVTAETLTASAVDSVNTFAMPAVVEPRPVSAILRGDQVSLTLAPKSVTVLSVRQ